MKKIVSFLMVAAMLASLLVMTVSAEQTNMEVTIPKFTAQPTFDGVVSAEEWGEKTLRIVTDGAATTEDNEVSYNEELGLRNIFYYFSVEGLCDTLAYDLWIRWDDQYLYLAAVVDDPDPFSLPKGGDEIWNGDCVQVRIDEVGPSGIMKAADPAFDYKTTAFNPRFEKPWSSDSEVFNSILGLVKGDTPTIWRCGKTYGEGWNLANDGGLVGITCVQNDDDTCTTTYEGAFPWSAVNATLTPTAGSVYGMGVAVACSDSDSINGCLQWCSGLMFAKEQPRGTRGGSQAIVLSDEAVTPAEGYAVATTEAETTEPVEEATTVADNADVEDTEAATEAPAGETTTRRQPASTSPVDDEDGLSTGAIVGIVIAVLVVVAVVAVIIVKKKKK